MLFLGGTSGQAGGIVLSRITGIQLDPSVWMSTRLCPKRGAWKDNPWVLELPKGALTLCPQPGGKHTKAEKASEGSSGAEQLFLNMSRVFCLLPGYTELQKTAKSLEELLV